MDLNPYSSPETLDATSIKHQPSRIASASFVLNILLAISMLVFFAFGTASERTYQYFVIIGSVGVIIFILTLTNAVLGIIGLLQSGQMRLLAFVAAISAVTVLGMAALLYGS